jgi:hypothetical protein
MIAAADGMALSYPVLYLEDPFSGHQNPIEEMV